MRTGLRRHLRASLAGSLLFGTTVIASVFVGSLPASASPAYAVAKTITVGSGPVGVAVDPNTGTVFVANSLKKTVSVISEATETVTKTIAVGNYPEAVAVDPNTGTVYVVDGHENNGTVSVISEATETVTKTIAVGSYPEGVAVDPNTGTVYVANYVTGTVSVISEATETVTKTIAVGLSPMSLAVDPNTGTVYVANYETGSVSVISEATETVTKTIHGFGTYTLFGVAVDPNTGTVYVANYPSTALSVISEATDTVTKTILGVGGAPQAVAVDPKTGTVYVAGNNTVVISEATDTVTNKIPGAAVSQGVAVDPDRGGLGGNVFVTNYNPQSSGTVSVITQAPAVTAVSPNSGPTSGGTPITITGTGFVSGATVVIGQGAGTVGAIAATHVTVVSPTEITAVTGGGSKVNVFNLFVTTPGGTSKANFAGDEFTYH
jgi:YVTN family beta-propeller protein